MHAPCPGAPESGYSPFSMGAANIPFNIKWPGPASSLKLVVRRIWEVIKGNRVDVDTDFATLDVAFT